jgi:hypothetical protein
MALVFSSFNDHLGTLPTELSRHGMALRSQVQQRISTLPDSGLSAFLFLPDQTDHPDHEDAPQVFAQAVEQMYLPKPHVGDEIPLLFLGYHAMSRLSGKRTSQGFLLTDQAMYVQDDFTVLLAAPLAQSHVLPGGISEVPSFVSALLERYKSWKDWAGVSSLPEPMLRERCGALLAPVVGAVVEYHAQHASQRQAPQRTWTLSELVADHDAADTLLDPLNPKLSKKLGKVSGKFQVPANETLQFALVDFPLFGGPYGLALTKQALYGKDLMEAPVRIALQSVDASALQITEKGDELLTGSNEPVALPAYMEAALREPFLAFLKQEIVSLQSQA